MSPYSSLIYSSVKWGQSNSTGQSEPENTAAEEVALWEGKGETPSVVGCHHGECSAPTYLDPGLCSYPPPLCLPADTDLSLPLKRSPFPLPSKFQVTFLGPRSEKQHPSFPSTSQQPSLIGKQLRKQEARLGSFVDCFFYLSQVQPLSLGKVWPKQPMQEESRRPRLPRSSPSSPFFN